MSKRKHARVVMHRKVDYRHPKGIGNGMLADLSTRGCLIEEATFLSVGTRLSLQLWLPDQEHPVKIEQAIVRWSKDDRFGVSFQDMSPDAQTRIGQVFQLLHEAQQPEDR